MVQSRDLRATGKCLAQERSLPLHPVHVILVELTLTFGSRHGHVTRPGQSVYSTLLATVAQVSPMG